RHLHGKPHHHFLVFAQELLAYTNVLVWKTIGGDRRRPLMPSSLLKVLTIGRAVDRIFPLRAAEDRTDVAPDAGTIPSCALLLTEFARIVHQRIICIVSSGHAADRPVSQGGARSRRESETRARRRRNLPANHQRVRRALGGSGEHRGTGIAGPTRRRRCHAALDKYRVSGGSA